MDDKLYDLVIELVFKNCSSFGGMEENAFIAFTIQKQFEQYRKTINLLENRGLETLPEFETIQSNYKRLHYLVDSNKAKSPNFLNKVRDHIYLNRLDKLT